MWTKITRPKYERDLLRYASDLTDGEWKVLEPLLPRAKALGRPRVSHPVPWTQVCLMRRA